MFRKTVIAAAALALSGGILAYSSAPADAHSLHGNRYERVRVFEPIIRWKWTRHHHHRIKVVVGHECHWIKVPRLRAHWQHDQHRSHRRY